MTVAGVTKWLDRVAKATKQRYSIKDYGKKLMLCEQLTRSLDGKDMPYAHLFKGIHEISELLDIQLGKLYDHDEEVCFYFVWKDVLFIQLDKKEVSK